MVNQLPEWAIEHIREVGLVKPRIIKCPDGERYYCRTDNSIADGNTPDEAYRNYQYRVSNVMDTATGAILRNRSGEWFLDTSHL